MAKRSLKATSTGIAIAKRAFQRTGWTQEYLASEVGLGTRQSIWKFFSGRPVERHIFIDICFRLDLDWQDVAEPPEVDPLLMIPTSEPSTDQVNAWVEQVRSHHQSQIYSQCQPLLPPRPQCQPLWLASIYTDLDFLPYITSQRWLEYADLATPALAENSQTPLLPPQDNRLASLPIVEAARRLIILGKPGAGKTTLLKQLALQCNQGLLKADMIPVFITLHHFWGQLAKPQPSASSYGLKQALIDYLSSANLSAEQIEETLRQGKVLLLLDGLDEVNIDNQSILYSQIQQLAQTFPKLSILMSQRTASLNSHFPGFEYVEIADLSNQQIEVFVKQWFCEKDRLAYGPSMASGAMTTARRFLKQLYSQKAGACQELARSPLFLTFLCSVFEAQGRFPRDLSRLYRSCLDLLLGGWDQAKGVHRRWGSQTWQPAVYLKILGHLATLFLEQETSVYEKPALLQIIASHLLTSTQANIDPEQLQLDSETVLETIVVNTGLLTEQAKDIYTFTYLILQKHLVSRKIIVNCAQDTQGTQLENLAARFTQPHWQEVGLITLGALAQKQTFINYIQAHLQSTIAQDKTLKKFIACLEQKLVSLQVTEQFDKVQSIYAALFQHESLDFWISLDRSIDAKSAHDIMLDLALYRLLSIGNNLSLSSTSEDFDHFFSALSLEPEFYLETALKQGIQNLKNALPKATDNLNQWWQVQGQQWLSQLRDLLINCRGIGHAWELSTQQRLQLQSYYLVKYILPESIADSIRTGVDTPTIWPQVA